MKQILFSPPDIRRKEIREVCRSLKSGWITTGPRTKQLERVIASFCGADNCVCLNSQTAAAELSLRVLGIGPGDEVIVPAYTYTASCSVIIHVGATPIIIDCQQDSLEMDYFALENAINKKTKAIIPVDLGGIPCNYDKIFDIITRKQDIFQPSNDIQKAIGRIAIVSDCAHALGSKYHGKTIGSIADFSNFSFHAVKNMTTAEGGAVTWNDIKGIDNKDLYHLFQLYSLHGQSKDALSKTKLGSWEYDVLGPWYKCNMTDVLASLGLSQMRRYNKMLKRRRDIIERYDRAFSSLPVKPLTHYCDEYQSSGHLYILRLLNFSSAQRNRIIEMMANLGIACNVHYKPLPMLTAYKTIGFKIEDFPNAYNFYQNEITLPLHTKLTNRDVKRIIKAFLYCYGEICEAKR